MIEVFVIRVRKETVIICFVSFFVVLGLGTLAFMHNFFAQNDTETKSKGNFIKYVEFHPTYECLKKAMDADISSHTNSGDIKINWIEVLSYLAAKYGGDFKRYKESDMDEIIKKLKDGENIGDITKNMKNYGYYNEAYTAVLGGFLGEYKVQKKSGENSEWEEKYGLKVFSPIAKTFPFCHYDDFGASRSYGYSRPHLGHDLMAAVGTPVIAVESGEVEVMGWNQYGGWRIGIRSFDKKRYYYYAHLRQNRPYHVDLQEGKKVKAGDVIGYVGRTGYSSKENINNIKESHLHLGLELIFDESQKESNNEIWIDLYAITKLLENNKSSVIRQSDTKEFYREFDVDIS